MTNIDLIAIVASVIMVAGAVLIYAAISSSMSQ